MRYFKLFFSIIIFIVFSCASSNAVLYEFDETVDFDAYTTFVLCVDDFFVEYSTEPELDNNQIREFIGDYLELEMISRGHKTNVLNPELQVGFELIVEQKEAVFQNCETEGEYDYWHECTIDTVIYKEETLVVYVLDFNKNQVVWQASIVCNMNKKSEKLEAYIGELVNILFNEYPKVEQIEII